MLFRSFVCKTRLNSYGVSFGLINSCRFISYAMKYAGIESRVETVVDANGIDKVVHDYKPTHVFIEALWVTADKMEVLCNKYPGIKWSVRIHSKTPFIAFEGIAFDWLTKYKTLKAKVSNFNVSANSRSFVADMKNTIGLDIDYLPNVYFPLQAKIEKDYPDTAPDIDDVDDIADKLLAKTNTKAYVHIGCFGAIRPLKNHLQQAVAAIMFANDNNLKLYFHINSDRIEQKSDTVLRNLEALFNATDGAHELVQHKWMPWEEFFSVVKGMDIGMQVSFSETFNIVAADFVWADVPVVVSPDIEWLPDIIKADPTDVDDIAGKLSLVYRFRRTHFHAINRIALAKSSKDAVVAWLRALYGDIDGKMVKALLVKILSWIS